MFGEPESLSSSSVSFIVVVISQFNSVRYGLQDNFNDRSVYLAPMLNAWKFSSQYLIYTNHATVRIQTFFSVKLFSETVLITYLLRTSLVTLIKRIYKESYFFDSGAINPIKTHCFIIDLFRIHDVFY